MGYILNQYNKPNSVNVESSQKASNIVFMTPVLNGQAKRKQNSSDEGVSGASLDPFFDECVQINETLSAGRNYYFHGKIKRLDNEQKFYIKLINYTDSNTETSKNKEQYIKTIVVQGGDIKEWVDVEFIFTPLIQFDTIVFQLQRTIEDYKDDTRYPVIVYEELSIINNIIPSQIGAGVNLLKIGVQSRPGMMMCINGEEIHVGKTGIYELRNGVITVSSFSVVNAAIEDASSAGGIDLQTYLNELATKQSTEKVILSSCIFNKPKLRKIDSFSLDYMYKEE